MVRLKEADTIYVGGAASGPDARFGGVIHKDTRYFSGLDWELPDAELLSSDTIGPCLVEHYALIGDNRRQLLAIRREIEVAELKVTERWDVANTTAERQAWRQKLTLAPSFEDIFAPFAAPGTLPPKDIVTHRTNGGWRFEASALDGRSLAAEVAFPDADDDCAISLDLAAGERRVIALGISLDPGEPAAAAQPTRRGESASSPTFRPSGCPPIAARSTT